MDYRALSDAALLDRLRQLASRERRVTADFVACLAEVDRRPKVVIAQGYPSLYEFCLRDLKLAQSSAYKRVTAAREANRRPEILSMLADGSLNLTILCLIAPLLEEHPALLEQVKGKSKRDAELVVAGLGAPRVIPDRIRPVTVAVSPPPRCADLFALVPAAGSPTQGAPPKTIGKTPEAETATRLEFRFSADHKLLQHIERIRALTWHKHPAGRLEDVLTTVCEDYLKRHDPMAGRRLVAAAAPPDEKTRRIPPRIRREVWRRDGGVCAFVGPAGRCPERHGLEVDHVTPWALGGRSDDPGNLRLLCRAHNQAEAERIFGRRSPRGESGG